jgi:hypothetical protein
MISARVDMVRRRRNSDIDTFKKDIKEFSVSAAGHIPGVGEVLSIYDTYRKAKRLAASTQRALKVVRRRTRSRINRTAWKMRNRFG